jgi:hypothetical protein
VFEQRKTVSVIDRLTTAIFSTLKSDIYNFRLEFTSIGIQPDAITAGNTVYEHRKGGFLSTLFMAFKMYGHMHCKMYYKRPKKKSFILQRT